MKLLIDANLSWRLPGLIIDYYPDSTHVEQTNLPIPAKDVQIWNFAKENNFIIVTNDEDFLELSTIKGFPPKVILLYTGNQKTKYIADLLLQKIEIIRSLDRSEDYGVLEIF